jgi:hypothetical protein
MQQRMHPQMRRHGPLTEIVLGEAGLVLVPADGRHKGRDSPPLQKFLQGHGLAQVVARRRFRIEGEALPRKGQPGKLPAVFFRKSGNSDPLSHRASRTEQVLVAGHLQGQAPLPAQAGQKGRDLRKGIALVEVHDDRRPAAGLFRGVQNQAQKQGAVLAPGHGHSQPVRREPGKGLADDRLGFFHLGRKIREQDVLGVSYVHAATSPSP